MASGTNKTLYYVHDPMCSWCWGFRPTWLTILENLPPTINQVTLLGGLAADSDQPMSAAMQANIHATWKSIQQHIPGTRFNFDFWEQCTPQRSTYPACRAVIAARNQHKAHEQPMILAIQEAYYLHAQNPSDRTTLIDLANTLSLDTELFAKDLSSQQTQQQLIDEMHLAQSLGAQGFPSLIVANNKGSSVVKIDYNHPEDILQQISS